MHILMCVSGVVDKLFPTLPQGPSSSSSTITYQYQPSAQQGITIGITTCKRFHLYERMLKGSYLYSYAILHEHIYVHIHTLIYIHTYILSHMLIALERYDNEDFIFNGLVSEVIVVDDGSSDEDR